MLVNTVSRSINSKHVVACSSQQRMLMEQPGQTTSASAHYSAHNHTTTQAAAPANHIQTHPSVQGHRSISTGTRPCHERNRLRPPSHESYPGHLGETIHQELAEDDSELRESLDPDDGFADEGDEVDADDDVDDDGEDRPLEEMVDDELFGPDSDEEADDDPLVQEIKRASKKRQLYVVMRGWYCEGVWGGWMCAVGCTCGMGCVYVQAVCLCTPCSNGPKPISTTHIHDPHPQPTSMLLHTCHP